MTDDSFLREVRGSARFARLLADARWALRSFLATRGLTATIVTTLALGLGVALASFSLLDALLMRPIGGVVRPGEIVRVAAAGERETLLPVTSVMRESLQQLPAFAAVCGVNTPGAVVTVGERVRREGILEFSGDCFEVLGVRPYVGRLLTAEDDRAGARVAVLTYDFWQQAFGGAPDVLERSIGIAAGSFAVVGVTEPDFRGLSNAFPSSLAVPAAAMRRTPAGVFWSEVVARRAEGVSLQQARAQVETAWPALKASSGLTASTSARQRLEASRAFVGDMSSGIENALRPMFEQPLVLTFALSVLMLVISVANAANLLVTRALARQREFAMRAALGAAPGDLWRQAIVETLVPVLAGALVAVPFAQAMTVVMLDVLRSSYLELDLPGVWSVRVAVFLTATIAAMTIAGSLVQGFGTTRRGESLAAALRASARTASARQLRTRVLLVAQIALAVMLVGTAARFVRTVQQYYAVDPGFQVDPVLMVQVNPLPGGYDPPPGPAYYEELLTRIEAIPGVNSASLTTWIPLGGPSLEKDVERLPADQGLRGSAVAWTVTDRFFESTGIPLREGGTFTRRGVAADSTPASGTGERSRPRTAILSASLARRLFHDGGAVGGRVRVGEESDTRDVLVVGVAADARLAKPQASQVPVVYLNYWEDPRAQRSPYLLVTAAGDGLELLAAPVADAIRAGGREFALLTRTLSRQRDVALTTERLLAGTSAAFGLMALAIVGVGLFGLLSHYVMSRRAEIGVRMTIGANTGDITRLLLNEVAGLLVLGGAAGVLLLVLGSRMFATLLHGVVPAGDPWLLGLTLVVVLFAAAAALVVPLRRATAIDPLVALRAD